MAVPIKKNLTSFLDRNVTEIMNVIYEKYGFKITYQSLSPSVLTSFSVKGIKVIDKDEKSVLEINNIKIDYNIIKLLKKDFTNGILGILIDGINLNVNDLLEVIPLFKKEGSSGSFNFEKIISMIPNYLKLKNLKFVYKHEQFDIIYFIRNIALSSKSDNKALELDIDSNLYTYIDSLNAKIVCDIGAFGAITSDFNNSQLNLSFTDISSGNFKMKKLDFHADYINDVIDIHTIQVIDPISIGVFYNISTKDFSAQINTDNITIDSVISSVSSFIENPELGKLKDARITTNTIVTSNIDDKKIKFSSNTGISVPDNIIPGGIDLNFYVSGDERRLYVKELKVESEKILANANLNLEYKGLKLSGIVELPYFILPNGNAVSTELYIEPLDNGFSGFSPQVFIGSRAFTAVKFSLLTQEDSMDFSFEMFDYSHLEETVPGAIKIDGSYLTKSKYLQSNISLNTLYIDSLVNVAAEILPAENASTLQRLSEKLASFVFSGDLYVSTDFKSLSYNIPYILLANVNKDNQVIMMSFNGTEQSIQLNQFSVVFGSIGLQFTGYLDKNPDTSDLFFSLEVTSASIPYQLTGTVMSNVCNIMGDYGTNVEVRFYDNSFDGFIEINNLPLKIANKSIIISTFSDLKYDKIDGPRININRFEIEFIDTNAPINPRLALSGSATKYGIQLDSVSYTDFYSALQGNTDVMIDYNDGILGSAGINLNLENPLSSERININGNISNPSQLILNSDNFINDFYIDLQVQVNNFCLDRFSKSQNEKNRATGSIYASGTVSHPYVTLGLDNFSMYLGASLLQASGNALLEDRNFSLIGMELAYGNMQFQSLEVAASLDDFSLDASCNFRMSASSKAFRTPINISVSNAIIPEGSFLPDTFNISFVASKLEGSLIKKSFPIEIDLFHSPGGTSILSSDNIGLSGFLSSDGILEMNLDNNEFLSAKIDGFLSSSIANIQLYDLDLALKNVHDYIDVDDLILFDKGNLTGEAIVTGSFFNPDINGNLVISKPSFKLPFITPQKVTSEEVQLNIVNNVINVPTIVMKTKKGDRIGAGFNIYLNKWSLDYIDGKVKTVNKDLFPGHLLMNFLKIEGNVSVDLDLFFQDSVLEISGDLFGENVKITSGLDSIASILKKDSDKDDGEEKKKGLIFKTDINVVLGTHTSIAFAPILRCIFVPNTKLRVVMDQTMDIFGIDGELKLRSGDIAYLNRNFYIKSGSLKFSSDDITNPVVTLLAETRERDDKGNPVKIIFEVENQKLLSLKPHFSSEPARSENEIRRILGQIALADSANATDFLFAAGDYAFQSTIIRQFENKLRDLLNFDIFSMRTNVFQNTLSLGLSGNLTKENFSIGNFLDNSTVYIGKYLGSYLYLDAMLHISFEHIKYNDIISTGSIIFQPEFGLEMESPFANIRFNLAPDINALLKNNQFVPSTSVTLSWDFTF